jgi:tRNAThr (cytosine32-N3)-methyltransferase
MDAYTQARALIDAAHAADPKLAPDGRPAELVYGERVEAWVTRLVPDARPILRLAARCQHLERWRVPRHTFPEGKAGYLKWRQSLYQKQAERARELLLAAGVAEAEAAEAATWISKTALKTNAGSQALEDAACLVFLENEIHDFASQHADYPREKFVEILRKTWRKMSPAAQAAALTLDLPPAIGALVREAVEAVSPP